MASSLYLNGTTHCKDLAEIVYRGLKSTRALYAGRHITGVWVGASSGIKGQSPWSGDQGAKPSETERFSALECPKKRYFWSFLGVLQ